MRLLVLATFTFCYPVSALADEVGNDLVDRALKVHLNQQGLDTIAGELAATTLRPIENAGLPIADSEVLLGIRAYIESAVFSLKFENVDIRATDDGLVFSAGIKDAKIHAPQIVLYKETFFGTIQSTCVDTDIMIGNQSAQTFTVQLKPRVAAGELVADLTSIEFDVASDNYEVSGPAYCGGPIGIGRLLGALVQMVLEHSKERIETAVKDQATAAVPQLARLLNDTLTQSFELDLGRMPYFPTAAVLVETKPHDIQTSANDVTMIMGIAAARPLNELSPVKPEQVLDYKVAIGSVGLNPQVIQEVLAIAFPMGSEWIEISAGTVPGLNEILRVSTASAIWPDLLESTSSSEYLRLLVKLSQVPEFHAGTGLEHVIARLESLTFKFQFQRDGEWIDYYQFDLSLRAAARFDMVNDLLSINLKDKPAIEMSGEWSPTYVPLVEEVEMDMAHALMMSVTDFLYYRGPLFTTGLPTLPLSTTDLSLSAPRVSGEFVEVSIDRLSDD